MIATSASELIKLFEGRFRIMLDTDWASWRDAYVQQVRTVQEADVDTWSRPEFQQFLWDDPSVSSIGPGQSGTLVSAYDDRSIAAVLFQARGSIEGLPLDQRGAALDDLYHSVLAQVHPRYTPRRPKARLARMLAAMFPSEVTCLMGAPRVWAAQRLLGAQRLSGDFMAQHPSIKAKLREALGRQRRVRRQLLGGWLRCQ